MIPIKINTNAFTLLENVVAEDMSFSLKYLEDKLKAARPGSSGHLRMLKMIIELKCLYILKKHC